MPIHAGNIVGWLFAALFGIVFILCMIRFVKNRLAPVRTVKAVVVDKHRTEFFSKYQGTGKRAKYVVVFSAEGKKRSFYVSEFSYGGYRLNEKGTLKYKGDRIIDFS